MSKQVFIVVGETGEYSDRREWFVAAFLDESKAANLVLQLEEWCRTNGAAMSDSSRGRVAAYDYGGKRLECPLDPHFNLDYTGTRYYVAVVELRD